MEASTEKSKVMTNSTNNINADIGMNDEKLEKVTSFKYLGANRMQRWHLLSRSPHEDCVSNGSNDASQVAERTQPAADMLFVCFCNVRGLKKRIPWKICTMSCFV